MPDSMTALCTDFYVNQKVALKMDLPSRRETVLDMFDRVRRSLPQMDHFRRYDDELALESPEEDSQYCWLALRRTSLRSGWVNPDSLRSAYRLHQLILEIAPFFLSISPIDVDYLELVFGFDVSAETNRNEVVFAALLGDSPLQQLIEPGREQVLDSQPFIGFSLSPGCDLQAFVEIKTRTQTGDVARGRFHDDPISIYLTVRKLGPLRSVEDFANSFGVLAGHAERLAEDRVIPHVVMPIRQTVLGH
jgi:hypothetical protein